MVYPRRLSISTGTRVRAFTDAVRARDGRCVVSKVVNIAAEDDEWIGFETAHIFPLAYESQWEMENYGQWITIDPPQGGKINSVQNGILLLAHLHQEWDAFWFSINPDVSYFLYFMMVSRFPLLCPSGQPDVPRWTVKAVCLPAVRV